MVQFEVLSNLNVDSDSAQTSRVPDAATVLEELFVLLEEYGPVWYTQEHHDRAVKALLGREG